MPPPLNIPPPEERRPPHTESVEGDGEPPNKPGLDERRPPHADVELLPVVPELPLSPPQVLRFSEPAELKLLAPNLRELSKPWPNALLLNREKKP
jgi:hypothetical protein